MLKNDTFLNSPLKRFENENENLLQTGDLGAVLARAGEGKTELLVQMGLTRLLDGINVLHVSLQDPIQKVLVWYEEVFREMTNHDMKEVHKHWEDILQHRYIMTFKAIAFQVDKFEERLIELKEQNIFTPNLILFDGFPFDEMHRDVLAELKQLVQNHGMYAWFSITTHRHEQPGPDGLPPQLSPVSNFFKAALQVESKGKKIYIKALKGGK
ncbi:MAG: cytoplasmic protein [SAR324 cluster bacterium]|nr:cytoplasmic protein [SAR324 cluster bacterium]